MSAESNRDINRGDRLRANGMFEAAIQAYNAVYVHKAGQLRLVGLRRIAETHFESGSNVEARKFYKMLIAELEKNTDVRSRAARARDLRSLALVEERLGNYDEAIRLLSSALPDHRSYEERRKANAQVGATTSALGLVYFNIGKLSHALGMFLDADALLVNSPDDNWKEELRNLARLIQHPGLDADSLVRFRYRAKGIAQSHHLKEIAAKL